MKNIDRADLCLGSGTCLVLGGLWWIHPPLTLLAMGLVFIFLGYLLSHKSEPKDG